MSATPTHDHAIRLTIFPNFAAKTKQEEDLSFPRLLDRIARTNASQKANLPWLKLARFGDLRSEGNSLRNNLNVLAITGIEADYDRETMGVAEAVEILQNANVQSIIYTSPSHTEDTPRWRVLCPLSQEYPPDRRDAFLARLNGLFGGVFSNESWTLPQSYYYGRVAKNPSHHAELIDGDTIDRRSDLDATAIGKPITTSTRPVSNGVAHGPVSEKRYEAFRVKLLDTLHREAVEGGKHHALLRIAKALGGIQDAAGFTDETAVQWLLDALPDTVSDWQLAARTAKDGLAYGRAEPLPLEDRANGHTRRPFDGGAPVDDIPPDWHDDDPGPLDADDPGGPLILNPSAPLSSARAFLQVRHTQNGQRCLHHQNDTFYTWRKTHYAEASREDIRSQLYDFLDKAMRPAAKGPVPFDPNRAKVANALEAISAAGQIPCDIRPPSWLDDNPLRPPPNNLIACSNGLLDVSNSELLPHTPSFFTVNALPFAFDPSAPEPTEWLHFLDTLWPHDQPSIDTLQEEFGLLLTGDTRHQKAFLLVGPRRSGKGTIARVVARMLGPNNICGPTLSSLGGTFGLQPLIDKRLAIIADARLGGKADQAVIVERLLSITGEDMLTIDRKNRTSWTGRLETRVVILTNELPRLTDASGALAGRFITLILKNSFFGKEDHGLGDRLEHQLPGILNWSLVGLQRLRARGHFVPPPASEEASRQLDDLGSPVAAFLRDRCEVGGHAEYDKVETGQLYNAWCGWCRDNGHDRPGTTAMFGRDLRAIFPDLKISRPRTPHGSSDRLRFYDGIRLK